VVNKPASFSCAAKTSPRAHHRILSPSINNMTGPARRSRSTTAASQRPQSRGSTASVRSGAPQQQHHIEAHYRMSGYNLAIAPNHHQMGTDYSAHQQSIIQNAANGVNSQDFSDAQNMSMSMNGQIPQHFQTQDHPHFYAQNTMSFAQQQQPVDYSYMQAQAQTSAPADTKSKKIGSQSSQTNDKELRELRLQNAHRSLTDVAQEVLATERTPRAEKTKQLFAMLWFVILCYVMIHCLLTVFLGLVTAVSLQRHQCPVDESTQRMQMDVQQSECSL
jgi:regulatory factor X